jgi:hypothetical protein
MAAADYPLDVRGDYDQSGGPVAHDFLQVFAGRNGVAKSSGSGRRELAEFLVSSENPLTARVYVNRVWQWVFGTGLVATPDDFGHLGEKPSHPELLDALAADFLADGWSTKSLLRKLLLSRTFRQSSTTADRGRETDPANRLLHHFPTRRLEAEALYDSILAVSGRLDRSLFGPPIDPPRTKEDATKRLFSGPLDNAGRRALYTKVALMQPSRFAVVFNFPDLKLPTGRRDLTNVPTQALALLNDPFVTAQADYWADRLVSSGHTTLEERLQTMFVAALGREAKPAELKRFSDFLLQPADGKRPTIAETLNSRDAWRQAAHLLFNTKEFLYYR